jgi:polysaccharide export outer membrane protein
MRTIPALLLLAQALLAAPLKAQGFEAPPPVRPGDQVRLWLFDRPTQGTPWTHVALVEGDGAAELPFVGRVQLAGLPLQAAQDTLRARLGALLAPGVGAAVVERRIVVIGAVRRPDIYHLDATMTVREAIGRAGGVDDSGEPRRLLLYRNGTARELRDWPTATGETLALHSGDQLVVPRIAWYRRNALGILSGFGVVSSLLVALSR